ncbi:glycosyltransferase [Candidatus Pelagibacter communis]|uniref:glycosyltransferase n=1 Tax=Pelagibacter ubique TaxID=198252 RepID=UPI00094DD384|nr:glycosyltransferase [Candidatus Pelagibacter ubique]
MDNRIIIFIPSIEVGGVEKNLFIISNYLKKKGLNVEILTCNYEKKKFFAKNIKILGSKSIFFQKRSRKIKYFISLIYLIFELLFDKKKTLVFAFQANMYSVIICKLLNKKIIIRSNSSPSGWSKNVIKKKIYGFLMRLADDVMVNSIDFKKEIKRKFSTNSECIYNPLDKSILKINNKKKIFDASSLKILNIGRLTDQKDHLTLLKAAKLIDKKLRPEIIIIGRGVNYNFLDEYIKKNNLGDFVKLHGFHQNAFKFIKDTNILVLTSKFEGLPNVLIEGQLFKKYIISTNCPTGPKEILMNGKCGDLINIGDYKKLAELINTFYKRKKIIHKKINKGTDNIDRFDYKRNCEKYYNFISRNF